MIPHTQGYFKRSVSETGKLTKSVIKGAKLPSTAFHEKHLEAVTVKRTSRYLFCKNPYIEMRWICRRADFKSVLFSRFQKYRIYRLCGRKRMSRWICNEKASSGGIKPLKYLTHSRNKRTAQTKVPTNEHAIQSSTCGVTRGVISVLFQQRH